MSTKSLFSRVEVDADQAISSELFIFPFSKPVPATEFRALDKFQFFYGIYSEAAKSIIPVENEDVTDANGKKAKKIWAMPVINISKMKYQILQLDWGAYQYFVVPPSDYKEKRNFIISKTGAEEGKLPTYEVKWLEETLFTDEMKKVEKGKSVEDFYAEKIKAHEQGGALKVAPATKKAADSIDVEDIQF
jgi:hypothetical protein